MENITFPGGHIAYASLLASCKIADGAATSIWGAASIKIGFLHDAAEIGFLPI